MGASRCLVESTEKEASEEKSKNEMEEKEDSDTSFSNKKNSKMGMFLAKKLRSDKKTEDKSQEKKKGNIESQGGTN